MTESNFSSEGFSHNFTGPQVQPAPWDRDWAWASVRVSGDPRPCVEGPSVGPAEAH